jgi:hypothetical protein
MFPVNKNDFFENGFVEVDLTRYPPIKNNKENNEENFITAIEFINQDDKTQSTVVRFNEKENPLKKRLTDFKEVFNNNNNKELEVQFYSNFNTLFPQLDPKKFNDLVIHILNKHLSYEETYKLLQSRIGEAKIGFFSSIKQKTLKKIFESLKSNIKNLSHQISSLFYSRLPVDGYIEYGSPGHLIKPLKDLGFQFTGTKWSSTEDNRSTLSDRVLQGFPFIFSYDKSFPSNNFEPIPKTVKSHSIDLLICPIGLHNIPNDKNKLSAFLDSAYRVLRVGGSLIIKEPDIEPDSSMDRLANVTESVYNAIHYTSLEKEMSETRDFQKHSSWEGLLTGHGFTKIDRNNLENESISSAYDPTQNNLLRFVKNANPLGEEHQKVESMERYLRMSIPNTEQPQSNTYLSTLKWHLQTIASEYSFSIISKSKLDFPFFKHIKLLWRLFIDSTKEAIAADGFMTVLKSAYMRMNLIMLAIITAEFAIKGIVYAPLSLRSLDYNSLLANYRSWTDFDASQLKEEPFYKTDYFNRLSDIWKLFKNREPGHFFLNLYLMTIISVEFIAKGIISAILSKLCTEDKTERITMVIEDTSDLVNNEFIDETGDINNNSIFNTSSAMEIKYKEKTMFKATHVKRNQFTEIMKNLLQSSIKIHSIAGCQYIQMKIQLKSTDTIPLNRNSETKILNEHVILTNPSYKYVYLKVHVKDLNSVYKSYKNNIMYFQDF